MTKEELIQQNEILKQKLEGLDQQLKIANENVETHKKAAFETTKQMKEIQLVKDEIKREYEKLEKAYNLVAQVFDEYVRVNRNSLQQLQSLSQASVWLEQNVTQKIQNINKGVEKE
jgi:chromosome segregation ATPase